MKAYAQLSPSFMETSVDQSRLVRLILLSFVLSWTWSVILAILAIIRQYGHTALPSEATYYTLILFCVFCPLQGFLTFLVLVIFSKDFSSQWKRLLCCRCFLRTEDPTPVFVDSERSGSFSALYTAFDETRPSGIIPIQPFSSLLFLNTFSPPPPLQHSPRVLQAAVCAGVAPLWGQHRLNSLSASQPNQ